MIAVFKNNKFVKCFNSVGDIPLPCKTSPEYSLYDIFFSDNDDPDKYHFILDVENRVKWFRKIDACLKLDGFTFWQRIKILFTGAY
jgi:hypothetical protein